MKFFDRKKEIETLLEIDEKSNTNAQFTVITGRRRIGKTALILNAYKDRTFIYLFVSKNEFKGSPVHVFYFMGNVFAIKLQEKTAYVFTPRDVE